MSQKHFVLLQLKFAIFLSNPFSFPSKCKIRNVKTLYKEDLKIDPKNFKSILLLLLISKLICYSLSKCELSIRKQRLLQISIRFQEILLNRLLCHLSMTNHKRFQYQYQKAFDTIDHTILILKIRFLCFTDETSKWNTSYFSNRQLNISIENTYSNKASIRFILYRKVQFWVHCSFALY